MKLKILFSEVISLTFLIIFFIIFSQNLFSSMKFIKDQLYISYYHLGDSYDQKMINKITPNFFKFTKFINHYTGKNAVILIPPQISPWQEEGNGAYIYYFIFPRKIVQGELSKFNNDKKITHILIAWGNPGYKPEMDDLYGWPKFKIKAKRIFYMDKNNPLLPAKILTGDYDPENILNKQAYGLIEL